MPDYRMNIKGDLGLNEYSNIFDYMSIVDKSDSFTITLEQIDTEGKNIINSMLKDSNFEILKEGTDSRGQYYISANKYE